MAAHLDLLALAEDVAAGRRTLDNVIDQIAVATPDDRARRAAVAELQSLVLGLTGVQAHARATAEATTTSQGGGQDVPARRSATRPSGHGTRLGPVLAGGASLVAAAVVVALLVGVLRPGAFVGGPSPSPLVSTPGALGSPSAGASSSPGTDASSSAGSPAAPSATLSAVVSPGASAPGTSSTASSSAPPRSVAASTAPPVGPSTPPVPNATVAFWQFGATDGTLDVWTWSPAADLMLRHALRVEITTQATISVDAIVSPDGRRIAVNERSVTRPELNRTRVFDPTGAVLWTSPANTAAVTDMVWSPDGTELVLGSIPSPWTVITFDQSGGAEATTYDVSGGQAYRLLGFGPDDAHLVGYETSGEAEFWENPVSLDLAHGPVAFTPLDRFPAGMQSNGTTARLLDRINPTDGSVLAITGGAKGPAAWSLVKNGAETPFGLGLTSVLTWADAATVAMLTTIDPPGTIRLSRTTGPGVPATDVLTFTGPALPSSGQSAPVALDGARGGLILVQTGGVFGRGAGGPAGTMLIDVSSGAAVQLPMRESADAPPLNFAGWIAP